ncbi:hypothetical protein D9615_007204 [Tricholomella constricta]|uniref:Endonuclease/exonuclease/phosphatase domain-containing protein n=1 Tax=Tricholomella constricta TaxID=117010 RepID=A0A8H5M184_9AGAR|nr:hypothetical protein D9615_007204 [Tricholomella constricta]
MDYERERDPPPKGMALQAIPGTSPQPPGTHATGHELDASGGERVPPADDLPNEGSSRIGGGQATRGRRESGSSRNSSRTPDNERRSVALGGVTTSEHPGPDTRNGAHLHPSSGGSQMGEGASPPSQSANAMQSAGNPQSAAPSSTPSGEPELEDGPITPSSRPSQHHAGGQSIDNQDEPPNIPDAPNSIPPEAQTRPKGRKSKRGSLGLATLNIKGGGSPSTRGKWPHLWQVMREQRLDVLVIQETHLDDTRKDIIQNTFDEYIHILHSWDRANPNAKGIAFVLNKRTTRWKEATMKEIIPGRAILLQIPWHEQNETKILGVYAPNSPGDNTKFWEDLEGAWNTGTYTRPDFLLGDTNIVEDSLDRIPARSPPTAPTEALGNLKSKFDLIDGWRHNYPSTRKFTFRTEGGDSQSRLDRIYIRENLIRFSHQWEISNIGISTDHKLVSVRVLNPAAPYLGKGRYAIPNTLLKHKTLVNEIIGLGLQYQTKLTELVNKPRDKENNPQREHKDFKDKVTLTIREYAKTVMPKIDRSIKNLEKDRDELLNNSEIAEDDKRTTAALIDERITQLEKIRHSRARDNLAAKCRLENETNSKFWYQLNRKQQPRDTIAALKKPNTDPPN